jgi:hypothetical protein
MSGNGASVTGEPTGVQLRHLLALTLGAFFATLLICLLIKHASVAQRDGISFYGVSAHTLPFLSTGFLVASFGLWRTAAHFSAFDVPALTVVGLRVVLIGLFVLLATPFNRGTFMNWAHMTTGVTLALIQVAITALLLIRRSRRARASARQRSSFGGLVAAASLPDWRFQYLLQGETLNEVGFGWCLIEWTYALHSRPLRRF